MSNTFIDRAKNSFLLLNVTIRKADPLKKSQVAALAAVESTKLANGVPLVARVGALGTLTGDLKAVISHFNAVRTYMYKFAALSSAEDGEHRRGDRLIPTAKVPEVLSDLAELKRSAHAALDDFMPRYRQYYAAKMDGDFGAISDVSLPDPNALAAKFGIVVHDPQPIPTFDADRLQLPAGLAAEIAGRREAALIKQLEGAKQVIIDDAEAHLANVEKQLANRGEGKRLHQSLIDMAAHHAAQLRGISEGYDNDPRIIALADLIDERIVSIGQIKNARTWRGDSAARAANAAVKSLKAIKAKPAPTQPTTTIVAGDSLLADLID